VPGVQPILLMAESLVLSATDGYAKASREPAFVNVHLAAGTRQGAGQLQNAYFDGSPMVVTAAMRDSGSFGDHNTLRSSGGFSQMGAVKDITKCRWEVWDARGIPTVTRRAFKAKSQGIEGRKVTEQKDMEAALRRGVDAMSAGEPYVLDVRVATVGAGADSTWHQRFKLRG
jgi:thiamine pyrophosphate-dependent acetolactate synthase large subunit-like protein